MLLREDMMSQRFTLFYAGFTAHAPALYFNQLQFIEDCSTGENEVSLDYISQLSRILEDKRPEYSMHLKTAISVADHMHLELLPEPFTPVDYFSWLGHYNECFETRFPMARIDHYYFLFARKLAEILNHLGLLRTYISFTLSPGVELDLSRKIDKCLKDIEYILFKLMAAAALLSSEPRQNYFNVLYRTLCQEFTPFKGIVISDMKAADLQKLNTSVEEFDLVVMDGFKKCIGMLKELGI